MNNASMEEFAAKFSFDQANDGLVGVERECFLTRGGRPVPIAPKILPYLKSSCNGRAHCYGYELSACQLEDKTPRACRLDELPGLMAQNEMEIRQAEKQLGFERMHCGTGPEDMPLDHYPDPRYDKIVSLMDLAALKAACRVTGVHVHVGMSSLEKALRVYNKVVKYFPMLCRVGCVHFDGRMDCYQVVVDSFGKKQIYSDRIMLFMNHLVNGVRFPPAYQSWQEFYERAVREGFVNDPRRLWDFIRISTHGSIEFRMFDSTDDLDQIFFWASLCHSLCKEG